MSQRCAAHARASASSQPSRARPSQLPPRNSKKFQSLLEMGRHAPELPVAPRPPLGGRRAVANSVPGLQPGPAAAPEAEPKPKLAGAMRSEVPAEAQQLDPLALALAASAPLAPSLAPAGEAPLQHVPVLDQIAQQLVKRIAWGTAGRKGAARIELGAGAWSGTTITVVSEPQGVSLELDVGVDVDGELLGQRLRKRLESKGLCVQDVTVR